MPAAILLALSPAACTVLDIALLYIKTVMRNGIPQGWSDGDSRDGIHTRQYYQYGKNTRWQRYTPDGQLIDEDTITFP